LSQISQTHKTPDKKRKSPDRRDLHCSHQPHITTHQTVENQAKSSQIVSQNLFLKPQEIASLFVSTSIPFPIHLIQSLIQPHNKDQQEKRKTNFCFFLSSFFVLSTFSSVHAARCNTNQTQPHKHSEQLVHHSLLGFFFFFHSSPQNGGTFHWITFAVL
jgi:hypothetical protein